MFVRRRSSREGTLTVILFLSITACLVMMIAGLLACLGLLRDIGAYLLGALALFVSETIAGILVHRNEA